MPATTAKISRPTLPDIFPRERLFQQLDQAIKRSVVWLSAPAGSGKTTLIHNYLDARHLPCLWYQVDEGDTDIATFFHYLGLAATKGGRHLPALPRFTPEYQFSVSNFSRRFFEVIYQRLEPHSIVVFDDYQDVPPDSAFHEVIVNGLCVLPPGITVIIISRTAPTERMTKLKAERRLSTMGWSDVKFTRDETEGIVAHTGWKPVSEEMLRSVHEKAQGWVAGVVLMMENADAVSVDLSVS